MEDKKTYSSGERVEYWGLLLCLFLLAVVGYGHQIPRFGLLMVVACYFIGKNLLELKKLSILIPLALLLVLGTRIVGGHQMSHVLRDYAYFSSPITAFIIGYFVYQRMSLNKFMLATVLFGTIYSLVYFLQITLEFNTLFVLDTEDTRYTIGTGTPSPVLAIVFIILGKQYLKGYGISNFYWGLFGVINFIAVFFFASRVYYFTLFLFLVPLLYSNFKTKYRKFGNYLFIIIFLGLMGVAALLVSGDNFLAEKMRNSISEMFIQSFEDYDSVIFNWRAYELYEAINTFMGGSGLEKILGFGFGKTVYLEYEMVMPLLTINEIPIFHNGFAYLLVKTGLVGVFLALLFTCMLLYKGYKYSKGSPELKFVFFLLLSSVLSFNFSMLVVNGFFSGESCYLVIVAGYAYSMLECEYKKQNNEKV